MNYGNVKAYFYFLKINFLNKQRADKITNKRCKQILFIYLTYKHNLLNLSNTIFCIIRELDGVLASYNIN